MHRPSWLTYLILLTGKLASRSFWDTRVEWVGEVPRDPWQGVRLIAILHHTSLAEGVYLSAVPDRVLRRIARHGVAPIADETMARPWAGRIFRLLVAHPVPVTRRRDETWDQVLDELGDPHTLLTLCPEGRMMRPHGRDKAGEPMTIKPGVADVLRTLGGGRMILAYSGGLHHVFPPGARLPKLFEPMKLRIETIDIAEYVAAREREPVPFVDAVIRDLTRRRDLYTPIAPGTPAAVTAEVVRRRHLAWKERTEGGQAAPEAAARDAAADVPPGPPRLTPLRP
jgi:1-acyl-sn-glycerol-3-phosphate acyltransferase